MPQKSTSAWNKFWSNPVILFITGPFRWVARKLRELWAKIFSPSVVSAPSPAADSNNLKSISQPVEEPPTIHFPEERSLKPETKKLVDETKGLIEKIESFKKRLERLSSISGVENLKSELQNLEARYTLAGTFNERSTWLIPEFNIFISTFEPKLVQLEATVNAEYTQEKMLQELLDFCAEQNIEGATEINNSEKPLAEKVTELKRLSADVIIRRQEKLLGHKGEYSSLMNNMPDALGKLNVQILDIVSPCWADVSKEAESKAGIPNRSFVNDLRAAIPLIAELEAKLKELKEKALSPQLAQSKVLQFSDSREFNSSAQVLESLMKAKKEEYEKMRLSDVHVSYKEAMEKSDIWLAVSPQNHFFKALSEIGREDYTDEDPEAFEKMIEKQINLCNQTHLASLEFKPDSMIEKESFRKDLNRVVQDAYKAIDKVRSLIKQENLLLKDYDKLVDTANYLIGAIQYLCTHASYKKEGREQMLDHANYQRQMEEKLSDNTKSLQKLIEEAVKSTPSTRSSFK